MYQGLSCTRLPLLFRLSCIVRPLPLTPGATLNHSGHQRVTYLIKHLSQTPSGGDPHLGTTAVHTPGPSHPPLASPPFVTHFPCPCLQMAPWVPDKHPKNSACPKTDFMPLLPDHSLSVSCPVPVSCPASSPHHHHQSATLCLGSRWCLVYTGH